MKTSISTFAVILSFSLLFFSLPSPSLGAAKCNAQDEKVLLQIKAGLNNPYLLASWTSDTDCCSWYALDCDYKTGRVIHLTIFDGNVSAQIPAAIGNLPYLEMLDMNTLTNLNGPIPSSLANLSRLNFLRLKANKLSGVVPSFLSQLKKLTFLDLSFNSFTGSIPPQLSQLPNLLALHLDHNRLSGNIPDSFGKFAGNTPDLYLSNNFLSGQVPKSLGYVNFSMEIDLSTNNLAGDASFLFGKNKTVQFVELSMNSFEFDLSKVEFPDSLTNLDLSINKIFGSLPAGLTQLNLQFLNVSYNNLCGQIPQGGKLQSFDSTAYDHNKCLCGAPLPAC